MQVLTCVEFPLIQLPKKFGPCRRMRPIPLHVSINSTSEEVWTHDYMQTKSYVDTFPLIQLPKKFGPEGITLPAGAWEVSINSTSEEVWTFCDGLCASCLLIVSINSTSEEVWTLLESSQIRMISWFPLIQLPKKFGQGTSISIYKQC